MIELNLAEAMCGNFFIEPHDTTARVVGISFSTGYTLTECITMARNYNTRVQSVLDGLGLDWQTDKLLTSSVRSRMRALLKDARRVCWQGRVHNITERQRALLCAYLTQEDASACGITALLTCIPLPSGRL